MSLHLSGFRLLTPEEAAQSEVAAAEQRAEALRRWPMSQRRPRCPNCGAFMPQVHHDLTKCKCCGESYASLQ